MKTYLLNISLLVLLSAVSLCGCSNDDEPVATTTNGTTLTVTARADGFAPTDGTAQTSTPQSGTPQTRASESGYTTTFVKGDQIGVFAVKNGSVIADCKNVPLTYNGAAWEGTVYKYAGATYFAYYPYTAGMNDKTSVDAIVTAFNTAIASATDQSTYAGYTACDLMTTADAVSPSGGTSLSFTFTHRMSLIEISLPVQKCKTSNDANAYEYSVPLGATFSLTPGTGSGATTIKPYPMGNDIYRYIVPAGTSDATLSGAFNTADGKTVEYTKSSLSLSAGNYKRLNVTYSGASTTPIVRALAVGDFYYSDGGICPGDVSNPPSEGCIGIVYSTDVNRIGTAATQALKAKGVNTPHGLVMALTNASDGCRWGNNDTDENSGGADGDPFKANIDQLKKQYGNVDGYGETHWIIDEYGKSGNALKDTYTAFYHASRYGTADSSTEKYAVPSNTTGWFIPGMGQWWDILSNLGKMDLTSYRENTEDSYTFIDGATPTAVANINKYLQKISGVTQFSMGTCFWSSSEHRGDRACDVVFHSNYLGLDFNAKSNSDRRVRCSFAF